MNGNSRDIELEKQIDAYIKGRLTQEEAEQLWVQLLKNPDYIDLLETELHVRSIVEQQIQQATEAAPTRRPFVQHPWRWAAAAVFVGLLVVTLSLFRGSSGDTVQPLALSSINLVEHLASPDVVRADKSALSKADSMLNNGFRHAISGQPTEALQTYEEVITTFPGDSLALSQAYFNVGILRFNSNSYAKASDAFAKALSHVQKDRILEEKTLWFMANTYIQLDELRQARQIIRRVYEMDGMYQEPANRLINRLNKEREKRE